MKKQNLYSLTLLFLLTACSTSKNTNTGGNNGNTSQQMGSNIPEKKIEKSVFSDDTKKPQPLQGNAPQERAMIKKKVNTNTIRTFEAVPSVPDTL